LYITTIAVIRNENITFFLQVICGWIVGTAVVDDVVEDTVVVGILVADADAYVVVDEVEAVLLPFKK
jgi:hypothetical protein